MLVQCDDLPERAGMILIGFQDTLALGACTVYVDVSMPTVALFSFVTDTGGVWDSPTITIPSNLPLFGLKFAVQGAIDSQATAPLGAALTNGVWLRTGY